MNVIPSSTHRSSPSHSYYIALSITPMYILIPESLGLLPSPRTYDYYDWTLFLNPDELALKVENLLFRKAIKSASFHDNSYASVSEMR
ncbi:hypothetical protein D9613_006454 [Agrocybe pediades]|uniref:Uncharacterized protein n=1 Tax=Agrocybe pediades TaxID=84607 RepID=A0A8H4QI56_9AGAR|nr:hypothetical protein D9613_006454 [Agrocybe pediades]